MAVTAIVAAAITALSIPIALAESRTQRADDLLELTALAVSGAGHLGAPGPQPALGRVVEAEQQVARYDVTGRIVAGTGPSVIDSTRWTRPGSQVARADGMLAVVVPVAVDGAPQGAIRAAEPLTAGRRRVWAQWARLAELGLLVELVAVGAAIVVGRRVARPIFRLGEDAASIRDGDFTVVARPSGVTEVDRVGTALSSAAARIGDLISREQQFSADLCHQLRTRLAGLRVTVEGELAHPRSDPNAALQECVLEIDRLDGILGSLLGLARETHPVRAPVDLRPTLDATRRRWREALNRAGRSLRWETEDLPPLAVSAAAIEHILDVLLDNAVKHGGGAVRVTVATHLGVLSLAVADAGSGIERPADLFLRRRSAHGYGIGLQLARRLAEAEGGRLRCTDPTPGSTTFEIAVPISAPEMADARALP